MDDRALTEQARNAIADPHNLDAVSAASACEIATKRALGKLTAPDDLEAQLEANDFTPLPITIADGLLAGALPRHHEDPFDRMLGAQASSRGLTVVTHDPRLSHYDVDVLLI